MPPIILVIYSPAFLIEYFTGHKKKPEDVCIVLRLSVYPVMCVSAAGVLLLFVNIHTNDNLPMLAGSKRLVAFCAGNGCSFAAFAVSKFLRRINGNNNLAGYFLDFYVLHYLFPFLLLKFIMCLACLISVQVAISYIYRALIPGIIDYSIVRLIVSAVYVLVIACQSAPVSLSNTENIKY